TSYHVQNVSFVLVAFDMSTVRVSRLSRPSARSDHHIAVPECGSVGTTLLRSVPLNFTVARARGSSTYRAAYECTVLASLPPSDTRSWSVAVAATRATAPFGYVDALSTEGVPRNAFAATKSAYSSSR